MSSKLILFLFYVSIPKLSHSSMLTLFAEHPGVDVQYRGCVSLTTGSFIHPLTNQSTASNWVQFQVQAKIHKMARRSTTLRHMGPQNYTAAFTMCLLVCANFQPNWRCRVSDTARKQKAPMWFNIHLKVQLTVTPKYVKPLLGILNHISNYSQIFEGMKIH